MRALNPIQVKWARFLVARGEKYQEYSFSTYHQKSRRFFFQKPMTNL